MRADDLRLDELVTFSDGLLSLRGRRVLLHDMHAMAQFRKELLETVGKNQAQRILSRYGYCWGQADAAAMRRVFRWEDQTELLRAGPRLLTLQGVTRAAVKSLELGPNGKLRMEVIWHASGEAEEHLTELGPGNQAACWILAGYSSGYASFCTGTDVLFLEDKCRVKGDRACSATGMDLESWGDRAGPILSLYQPADIKGKIRALTQEVRRKTEEVERQRQRLEVLEKLARPGDGFAEVRSRAFHETLELASRVARFDSAVLITGESGVGKEVVARFIHEHSTCAQGPFLAVNCGAIPETLLESELFGHKAGSFTGASHDRVGLFEQASGGTIFLDEIGDVCPALQVKLLRVLQEKEIMRVGESRPRRINARVIAATNRDLREAVKGNLFREDLFYRLSVVEIRVPPLRERPEDVLPLARHFVRQLARRLKMPGLHLDASCLDVLMRYAWPGNVRELQNSLERAAVLSSNNVILPECMPPVVTQTPTPSADPHGHPVLRSLAEVEREHVLGVLSAEGGNRTRAAKTLGISPVTLWRKLKEWGRG